MEFEEDLRQTCMGGNHAKTFPAPVLCRLSNSIHSNSAFRCPSNSVESVKVLCPPVPPLSLLTFLFPLDVVFVCFICGDGVFNSFTVFAAENVVLAVAFYFV